MSRLSIVQIVPRLCPPVDGVGDYVLHLARQLRRAHHVESSFLVGEPNWKGPESIEGIRVAVLPARTAQSFYANVRLQNASNLLLLHYVGYGYARRGCPLWLLNSLKEWKRQPSAAYLITMFHELYAFGPPWRSSFWLSPVQRKIAMNLARLSDALLTNRQAYAATLREWKGGEVPVLPVFSNVGEPAVIPPLKDRPRRLVMFGKDRSRIYRKCLPALKEACRQLEITEIYDIGPASFRRVSRIDGMPVIQMGEMPIHEVSSLLLKSYAGFFDRPTNLLAKSGVFAAYCAHGLLPITCRYTGDQDGLERGRHYLVLKGLSASLPLSELQLIADNAHRWYQNHNLQTQARLISSLLSREFI